MELCYFPKPVLLKACEKVTAFDDELEKTAGEMFRMMYETRGVGLAGPQAGLGKMIAVINPTGEKDDEIIIINPEIIESDGAESMEEGCLSCPGINAQIKRAKRIKVRYRDVKGNPQTLEAEGLLARIIQHEVDHLQGRTIIDRMSPTAKILHKRHISSLKKAYEEGE